MYDQRLRILLLFYFSLIRRIQQDDIYQKYQRLDQGLNPDDLFAVSHSNRNTKMFSMLV